MITHTPRNKLSAFYNINHAIELFRKSTNIMFVCGAGISVSCGIPDFRSENGIYTILKDKIGSKKPEEIFDIRTFRRDPSLFYARAGLAMPGIHQPSPTHQFLARLAQHTHILRLYTQNIDMLEEAAGFPSDKLVYCHGALNKAHCLMCKKEVSIDVIRDDLLNGRVAYCQECKQKLGDKQPPVRKYVDDENKTHMLPLPPVYKPDIIFYGEDCVDDFYRQSEKDFPKCDLLVVMGTSLVVDPVNEFIYAVEPHVPQILINMDAVGPAGHFDIYLLGECDAICGYIAQSMGWEDIFTRSLTSPASVKTSNENAQKKGGADEEKEKGKEGKRKGKGEEEKGVETQDGGGKKENGEIKEEGSEKEENKKDKVGFEWKFEAPNVNRIYRKRI